MSTDLFFGLTPDWVLRAVEVGGFEPTGHVQALHCLENRVYDLRLEDGSHVIAKFYRPGRWSREAILDEHTFLFDLEEREIPACAPLRFEDGETLHEVEGIQYAVWPRTGGRSPEELNDDEVAVLGRLVARIHAVGALRTAPQRGRIDATAYAREPAELLQEQGFLPPQWASRYRVAVDRISEIYDELVDGVPHHRVHGDCHFGNLLRGRDGWFFLDFDDFRDGPAVQDVWMLVPGRDDEGRRQRELFIEAYQQFWPFQTAWLRLVEPLRALRFVHYAAWIARRWHDPAFPRSFPQFNEEVYWQRETLDLEDQLREIEAGAGEGSLH